MLNSGIKLKKNRIKVLSGSNSSITKNAHTILSIFPELDFDLVEIKIKWTTASFQEGENNINDILICEIENALLNNTGDIAIYPAENLSFPMPFGLTVFALTKAFNSMGALVSKNKIKPADQKKGVTIDVNSDLRKKQLLLTASCAINKSDIKKSIAGILSSDSHLLQGQLAVVGRTKDTFLHELFGKIDIRKFYGKVIIVGFGPGHPDYLTIKGKKALENADIIFHDDLIDKNYLSILSCEKVYVGKRKGNHSREQDEINRLLYHAALSGKNVVRLKGGDPAIFGRLGEEVQYLGERLIEIEIIPGVTSASAACAEMGLPLTWRGISSSIAFCSGHNINKIKIPDAGVLVFFMAATNLFPICQKLIATGWRPDTPVAIASNISLPNQKIYIETLGGITPRYKAVTPSIIIIGELITKSPVYQNFNHERGKHIHTLQNR